MSINMADAEPSVVRSLAEFDGKVKALRKKWNRARLWFRGHQNAEWELKPVAYRDPFHAAPNDVFHHMFTEFKRRAIGLIPSLPTTQWGWLYLAQHHGLPTRFLDWSESSHVAALFAVGRMSGARSRKTDACVWVMNPGEVNRRHWNFSDVVTMSDDPEALHLLDPYVPVMGDDPEQGKSLLCTIPEYVTERLRGQRGAFVAFGRDPEALNKLVTADDPVAHKVVVPRSALPSFQRELDLAGTTESTVFPDLNGLCSELARRSRYGTF